MGRTFAILFFLVGLGTSHVRADAFWRRAPLPNKEEHHAIAYDSDRHVVVEFSGTDVEDNIRDVADTWEWDGDRWSLREPASGPPGREFDALAYDGAHHRTVLFGGDRVDPASGQLIDLSDTWQWDGTTWTQSTPATAPPSRYRHALAFDSVRGRVVLFGGLHIEGASAQLLGDTWEWDGVTWTERTPAVSPPARGDPALAFDSARGVVVLFGGWEGQNQLLSDTWEWNGTDWTQRNPLASPAARYRHGLAYDTTRQRTVLFGGAGSTAPPPLHLGDTWEWDGTNWVEQFPTAGPPIRGDSRLAYDSLRGVTVLFGGYNAYPRGGSHTLDDTWEWDGVNWLQVGSVSPPMRVGAGLAYDHQRGRIVMFGGRFSNGDNIDLADTWEFDGRTWIQRTPRVSPPARAFHALAYDSARGRTVLFGGMTWDAVGLTDHPLGDTWEWDGVSWTQRFPAVSPQARGAHAMVYDRARARTVLWGGGSSFDSPASGTWEWDGGQWVNRTPGGQAPCCAFFTAMVYDETRGRTVQFGGGDVQGNETAETWEWDGNAWVRDTTQQSPPARFGHTMTYDALRGRVVLFGGLSPHVRILGDTWEFDGQNWIANATAAGPAPRYAHGMAFDSARGRNVLFGGYDSVPVCVGCYFTEFGDTWELGDACVLPAASTAPGRRLFNPRCASDASGLPQDIYDSLTIGLVRAAHDNFYLSSSGFGFTPIVVDDRVHIDGADAGIGPYAWRPGVPPVPLDIPIDDLLVPARPQNVTDLIPMGSSSPTFDLLDTDRATFGNTAIYLLRDCGLSVAPGAASLDFSSHDDQVPFVRPPEFDIRYGLVSQLRADGDFRRAVCLGHFVDTPASPSIPNPPVDDGYYFLARGLSSASCYNYGDSTLVPDPRRALDAAPVCP